MSGSYLMIGVDVGKKRDPTTVCVALPELRQGVAHFAIPYLSRLPLGTPYPQVVDRLVNLIRKARRRAGTSCAETVVFIDATGVGVPVVDMLSGRARGLCRLRPVYLTGGTGRRVDGDTIKLSKTFLVRRLQALFGTDRLHLASSPEASALVQELDTYEIRVNEKGNPQYGAFRAGTHDDLVTALALAVQEDVSTAGRRGGQDTHD